MTSQEVVKCVSIASLGSSFGLIAVRKELVGRGGGVEEIMLGTHILGIDRRDREERSDPSRRICRSGVRLDGNGRNSSSPSRIDTERGKSSGTTLHSLCPSEY